MLRHRARRAAAAPPEPTTLRETVRERYAAAAPRPRPRLLRDARHHRRAGRGVRRRPLRRRARRAARHRAARLARLRQPDRHGRPPATGEIVLDLGSGGGIDVLLSARRVGPTGTAYGLDMTDEMLDLARANQAKAGVDERRTGSRATSKPSRSRRAPSTSSSPTASSTSPPTSRRSCARPRACSSPAAASPSPTSIADPDMDDATRADMQQYVGCIAGALTATSTRATSPTPA